MKCTLILSHDEMYFNPMIYICPETYWVEIYKFRSINLFVNGWIIIEMEKYIYIYIYILGVIKRNPLFFHSISCKNNGFLFTTPNIYRKMIFGNYSICNRLKKKSLGLRCIC